MIQCLVAILLLAAGAMSEDISLSKDSLWVFNEPGTGRYGDSITITNNGTQAVRLDSARIRFGEWHTKNPIFPIARSQVMIREFHHGQMVSNPFTIDSVEEAEYRLDFSFSSRPVFSIDPNGDSTILVHMEIGRNFFGDMPVYPQYCKALMRFYFSNGQTVEINIYTDDLRPTSLQGALPVRRSAKAAGNGAHYLINGQKIPIEMRLQNQPRIRGVTCGPKTIFIRIPGYNR